MKLTPAQQKAVIKAIVIEMGGETLAFGSRWGYNDKEVCALTHKKSISDNKVYRDTTRKIGDGTFKKALYNANVFKHINTLPYDQFYQSIKIDYKKLFEFSNGKETLEKAIEDFQERVGRKFGFVKI